MTIQLLSNAVIGVLLIGWIGYRQLTWRPVSIARMWRLPVVLGALGLLSLGGGSLVIHLSTLDLAVFLVEIALSLGIGALMGVLATFRPLSDENAAAWATKNSRRGGGVIPSLESRTGWIGMVLWIALIVVRIIIDAFATSMGSQLAAASGLILVMVAVNRAARTLVFAYRVDRIPLVAA